MWFIYAFTLQVMCKPTQEVMFRRLQSIVEDIHITGSVQTNTGGNVQTTAVYSRRHKGKLQPHGGHLERNRNITI